MRILFVNHEYPPIGGGSAIAMQHLAQTLAGFGHDVAVVSGGNVEQHERVGGVEVHRFASTSSSGKLAGLWSWVTFVRRGPAFVQRVIQEFRPDVINSHFLFPAGYVVARTGTKIPHVSSAVGAELHDPSRRFPADKNWVMRKLIRRVVDASSALTTSSRDLTERLCTLYPQAAPIEIPWGVPPVAPDPRTRTDLGLTNDMFVITTLCRLVPRKRLDLLLRAVAGLNDPRVQLVVMGFGPQEQTLQTLAAELGISAQVTFTGRVSDADKAAYLQSGDVFCLPSDHEGFGLVLVESMSLGTPAIASDVRGGGDNEIIRDGVDGFLFPQGDVNALTNTLRLMLQDRTQLDGMRQQAQARAREFSPENAALGFQHVYEGVLVRDRPRLKVAVAAQS